MYDATFPLADFRTQSGITLDLQLAYRVHGEPNAAGSNIVLLPTYFSGRASDNDYLIGEHKALDPGRYCIVVPSLFGNGVSSSPSNAPAPWSRSRFPRLTYFDNVAAQHALLTQVFGANQLQAVIGFSMGAMQAWQWAAQYPSMVQRVVSICGSARTAEHNQLFLDGLVAALTADGSFRAGEYDTPPIQGLEAFSVVYAGWFASQRFFADQRYREAGINDLAGLVGLAKQIFMSHDANDLLAMAATWRAGDPGANDVYAGSFEKAMQAIGARALVMPCDTDLYFRVSDNEAEVAMLKNATLAPIRSDFGHLAGGGFDSAALTFITARIHAFLAE